MKGMRIAVATLLASAGAQAHELEDILEQRLAGDRSGVCVAAVQVSDNVEYGFYCADADNQRSLEKDSRFEIGSISKAILGLLVAQLIESDRLSLKTTLATMLPENTAIPEYDGQPIRVVHLLTHTAGLPRLPQGLEGADMDNPYADYTPEKLLAALEATELTSLPGESYAYSNFGAMLLSLALAHHTGEPLETLFEREIFQPLGMTRTGLSGETVPGHGRPGHVVNNWDFHPDLGGVGAIRSTPADMARWLEANLDRNGGSLSAAVDRSHQVLLEVGGQDLGYGWAHMPLGNGTVLAHDGGTGGFSSFAVVDSENGRASLVLMDTTMVLRGSLGDLALHLVDSDFPLEKPEPRVALDADIDLEHYTGRFALFDGDEPFMGDFVLEFRVEDEQLLIQASVGGQVQPWLPMAPDGRDRFTITEIDLAIEFQRNNADRVELLDFSQGPLELHGERL